MASVVVEDAELLLDLLNTRPIVNGVANDRLAGAAGARWLGAHGLPDSPADAAAARRVRDAITAVLRGRARAETLQPLLAGVSRTPVVEPAGVRWELHTGPAEPFGVRCVLAWSRLAESLPGRLRPCANEECGLFLLDRSRANARLWCSMSACGNRLKARRHYRRVAGRAD
ncbi:CGNR zinc finger domain-containing protein [Kitasatospora sp. NPDC004272]